MTATTPDSALRCHQLMVKQPPQTLGKTAELSQHVPDGKVPRHVWQDPRYRVTPAPVSSSSMHTFPSSDNPPYCAQVTSAPFAHVAPSDTHPYRPNGTHPFCSNHICPFCSSNTTRNTHPFHSSGTHPACPTDIHPFRPSDKHGHRGPGAPRTIPSDDTINGVGEGAPPGPQSTADVTGHRRGPGGGPGPQDPMAPPRRRCETDSSTFWEGSNRLPNFTGKQKMVAGGSAGAGAPRAIVYSRRYWGPAGGRGPAPGPQGPLGNYRLLTSKILQTI